MYVCVCHTKTSMSYIDLHVIHTYIIDGMSNIDFRKLTIFSFTYVFTFMYVCIPYDPPINSRKGPPCTFFF